MNYTDKELLAFAETDKLVQTELNKLHIPKADFDMVCDFAVPFSEDYKQLREDNYTAFFILILTAAYNAGKESAVLI